MPYSQLVALIEKCICTISIQACAGGLTCEKLPFLLCRANVANLISHRMRPSSLKASLLSLSRGPYLHQMISDALSSFSRSVTPCSNASQHVQLQPAVMADVGSQVCE